MPHSQPLLCVNSGILQQIDAHLNEQVLEDLQSVALYAQLAADKAFSKGVAPADWHSHFVAALVRLGFDFPTVESGYFTVPAFASHTLADLLSLKWRGQQHWPQMAALMQSMARLPAAQAGAKLLAQRSVFQMCKLSSIYLLLWQVSASGEVDQWFVQLQTRSVLGPNLFTEALDAHLLVGPVRLIRHAGFLGPRFAEHREVLLAKLVEPRRALLLDLGVAREAF